jgi:hypothetical protein
VFLIVGLVGDISIGIVDGYYNLNGDDLVAGQLQQELSEIDIEDANKQGLVLLLIEPSRLPLVPSITVSNTVILDTEKEVLTALTMSSSLSSLPRLLTTAPNFKSFFLSSLLSLVLDCPILNTLGESISGQPSASLFITIASPSGPTIPGPLKAKRIKEKTIKKKNKIPRL